MSRMYQVCVQGVCVCVRGVLHVCFEAHTYLYNHEHTTYEHPFHIQNTPEEHTQRSHVNNTPPTHTVIPQADLTLSTDKFIIYIDGAYGTPGREAFVSTRAACKHYVRMKMANHFGPVNWNEQTQGAPQVRVFGVWVGGWVGVWVNMCVCCVCVHHPPQKSSLLFTHRRQHALHSCIHQMMHRLQ